VLGFIAEHIRAVDHSSPRSSLLSTDVKPVDTARRART
jgi:hypothetical protein